MSVVAHTAVIAAALYATARANGHPPAAPTRFRDVFYVAPAPNRPASAHRGPASAPARSRHPIAFVVPPISVETRLPAIDLTSIDQPQGDFNSSKFANIRTIEGDGIGPAKTGGAFDAGQVEKQVAVVPGAAAPRYPERLRRAGVEGQVTALFIVDERGRVEEQSIRFPRSDNALFEDAVRVALRSMRFTAAEVGGRKVRQLVELPFVFTLPER
jgi:protein TonB